MVTTQTLSIPRNPICALSSGRSYLPSAVRVLVRYGLSDASGLRHVDEMESTDLGALQWSTALPLEFDPAC